MNKSSALIIAILFASPAFAQWGSAPPANKPAPAPAPAATAAPEPAPAPPPPPKKKAPVEDDGSGFAFGFRGAWAFPVGDLNNTDKLGDQIAGQLPIWVEAGWRFSKSIYAGLYYQYAFGFSNNCNVAADCSNHGMKFGVEGIYNMAPDAGMQPWVGLGFGYETLSSTHNGLEASYKGLELLNLNLGMDFAMSKQFSIGPYASYSLFGKYASQDSGGFSNSISAGHNWLQLGLKATIKL